jgi:hypothetical protein
MSIPLTETTWRVGGPQLKNEIRTEKRLKQLWDAALEAIYDENVPDAEANKKIDAYNRLWTTSSGSIGLQIWHKEDCREAGFIPAKPSQKS